MKLPISLRAPEFWWRKTGVAAALLYPAAAIYGAVAGSRMSREGYRAKIPVLCIGNPTMGGAGKTPTAIATANFLIASGRKPFFLTRGYRGTAKGPLLVDLAKHNANDVGDEAPLLAAIAPTIVSQDRAAGAKLAEQGGADILIMDDGFQNPSIAKNFSLLVIDGARGIGNGLPFPAGPLRAPIGPQLRRAQAMLVIGAGEAGEKAAALANEAGLPVLRARLVPEKASTQQLAGKRVYGYAGIGSPEKFFHSLEETGAIVAAWKSFGDHHRYKASDETALLQKARAGDLILVTTEKDMARLRGDEKLAALRLHSHVLNVKLVYDDENAALAMIKNSLGV